MYAPSLIERPVTWVALAGFMGTGKSRIGWELSRELALNFIDTDKLITRVVGKSISEVFAQEGEGFFRQCERETVCRVSKLDYAVVSLGGGTFIHEDNRRHLLRRGPVVVLWSTPEVVYQRTRKSTRPLLQTMPAEDPVTRIRDLMSEREPVYRQGTIHVNNDGRPTAELVAEIIERLWGWAQARAWSEYSRQSSWESVVQGGVQSGVGGVQGGVVRGMAPDLADLDHRDHLDYAPDSTTGYVMGYADD